MMSCLYLFSLLQLSNLALALPAFRRALFSLVNSIPLNDTFTGADSAVTGQPKLSVQSLVFDVELQA